MKKQRPNKGEVVVSPEMAEALRSMTINKTPFDYDTLEEQTAALLSIKSDPVEHPSHYANSSIECWDAIKASMTHEAFCGYLKGNVQKYIWRYEKKVAPVEDLRKASVYLNKLIEEVENGSESN